jgi:hypothetical protein
MHGVRTDPCRIFTCVGFMAGSVVCVQIARLWQARGFACLRIVPCEHFPQEDPGGTAGRPGSSPPASATHSAGADHPRLPEPASGASLFRNLDTVAVPTARLLPAPGSTSAISRRSPAATSAPGCRRCSARWSLASVRGHAPDAPVKQQPGHPAARRTRPAPAAPVTSTSPLTRAVLSAPRRLARQHYNQ